ncbi:hypothetical protein [Siccirubricoccus phaeus]|uniref:hypothetical protein n=1 Tax=Siccirubricoccus phaeus TaxID=2595053 RepID=UPI0011F1E699|nr:hypothetical protein [Siccirubricoccus phaeus]
MERHHSLGVTTLVTLMALDRLSARPEAGAKRPDQAGPAKPAVAAERPAMQPNRRRRPVAKASA